MPTWLIVLLLLLAIPSLYLCLIFAFLGFGLVHYFVSSRVGERIFRHRIAQRGRYRSPKTLGTVLEERGGTITIDSPRLGWNYDRAWWVPERLRELAPSPPHELEEPIELDERVWPRFDEWCLERYLDPESGTALLVCVGRGRKVANQLRRRFPGLDVVKVSSCLRVFGDQAWLPLRCPCCFCRTLSERGVNAICPVCFWEDDGQDESDADVVRGGPNAALSLTQARANYRQMGAWDARSLAHVRAPTPEELPDQNQT